ncbi:uncharacterized protein LOC129777604 [Toxorhynchites rutilus septentrionalis]|uniref:uncharacterized protein LOC129777604 n=1 Tax=Toxorhynchites rutilus septentrionalis TaxID=329112 RepID=UPI00247967CF|nr:uncharacterized protein LOC129777604 [Toxorhynchites rutilus septentrionalis]
MPLDRSPPPGKQTPPDEQQPVPTDPQRGSSENSESFHGFQDWEVELDTTTVKELTGIFRQRAQVQNKVMRIRNTLQSQQQLSLAQLNVMSKNLSATYAEFSTFHSKAMPLIPNEAIDQQEEVYAEFEELHNYVSTTVEELILTMNNTVPQTKSAPQVIVQQKPLKAPIPTFDGSYSNWPKFKAVFQDLMTNSGDSEALKLYHLDKALVGDAAGVLDARILSEGNYQQAWNVLSERFENKRVIVESHLHGLLSLKPVRLESHKELRALLNEVSHHVESLRFLDQDITGVSEHFIVYLINIALDKSTRKAWESTQRKGELPKYEHTINFLKSRCQILESCESAFQRQVPVVPKAKQFSSPPKYPLQKCHAASTSPSENVCEICSGAHRNFQCTALNNLTAVQKNNMIRTAGLCFNCLRKGHRSKDCNSDKTCRKCQRRHHTLLHEVEVSYARPNVTPNVSVPIKAEIEQPLRIPQMYNPMTAKQNSSVLQDFSISTPCSCYVGEPTKTVLLLTAVVHALDQNNRPHPCRVLLDSGSQVNFVTEEMANRLGVPKKRANVPITGINALRSLAREKINISFRSRVSSFHANLDCLVTTQVTGTIPTSKLDIGSWNIPTGLILADPQFHTPAKIDMLIGAEIFFDIFKPSQLLLEDGFLICATPTLDGSYLELFTNRTLQQ